MDHGRFDSFTRALARPKTRRGLLGGLAALAVGARASSAQSDCPIPGQTRNRKGDCTCPAGQGDVCPEVGCTNRRSDPSNCGACGNACEFGEVCRKGECRCPSGVTCGQCTPDYEFCTEGVTVCCNGGLGNCYLRFDCGPGHNETGVCC